MKRGKALVALLRSNPGVRDPEALAAYAGRVKKYRKAGLSPSKAVVAAKKAANAGDQTRAPKEREPKNMTSEERNAERTTLQTRRRKLVKQLGDNLKTLDPLSDEFQARQRKISKEAERIKQRVNKLNFPY